MATDAEADASFSEVLPACAVTTHAAYPDGGTSDPCADSFPFGGALLGAERFSVSDEGCVGDDGAAGTEGPVGGMPLDGDYDLARFRSNIFGDERTRRTLRVFNGGTYIEWLADNEDPGADGGFDEFRYDTSVELSGNTLAVRRTCGPVTPTATYGFSAQGDSLTLFNYRNGSGPLDTIYGYQRVCWR